MPQVCSQLHDCCTLLQGGDATVSTLALMPKNLDHVLVTNRSSAVFIMTLQGQVGLVPQFSSCHHMTDCLLVTHH